MKQRDRFLYAILSLIVLYLSTVRSTIERQEAKTNLLEAKLDVKVEQLNYMSGRKKQSETLKEELERIGKVGQ